MIQILKKSPEASINLLNIFKKFISFNENILEQASRDSCNSKKQITQVEQDKIKLAYKAKSIQDKFIVLNSEILGQYVKDTMDGKINNTKKNKAALNDDNDKIISPKEAIELLRHFVNEFITDDLVKNSILEDINNMEKIPFIKNIPDMLNKIFEKKPIEKNSNIYFDSEDRIKVKNGDDNTQYVSLKDNNGFLLFVKELTNINADFFMALMNILHKIKKYNSELTILLALKEPLEPVNPYIPRAQKRLDDFKQTLFTSMLQNDDNEEKKSTQCLLNILKELHAMQLENKINSFFYSYSYKNNNYKIKVQKNRLKIVFILRRDLIFKFNNYHQITNYLLNIDCSLNTSIDFFLWKDDSVMIEFNSNHKNFSIYAHKNCINFILNNLVLSYLNLFLNYHKHPFCQGAFKINPSNAEGQFTASQDNSMNYTLSLSVNKNGEIFPLKFSEEAIKIFLKNSFAPSKYLNIEKANQLEDLVNKIEKFNGDEDNIFLLNQENKQIPLDKKYIDFIKEYIFSNYKFSNHVFSLLPVEDIQNSQNKDGIIHCSSCKTKELKDGISSIYCFNCREQELQDAISNIHRSSIADDFFSNEELASLYTFLKNSNINLYLINSSMPAHKQYYSLLLFKDSNFKINIGFQNAENTETLLKKIKLNKQEDTAQTKIEENDNAQLAASISPISCVPPVVSISVPSIASIVPPITPIASSFKLDLNLLNIFNSWKMEHPNQKKLLNSHVAIEETPKHLEEKKEKEKDKEKEQELLNKRKHILRLGESKIKNVKSKGDEFLKIEINYHQKKVKINWNIDDLITAILFAANMNVNYKIYEVIIYLEKEDQIKIIKKNSGMSLVLKNKKMFKDKETYTVNF
jgi:hypothetical protein